MLIAIACCDITYMAMCALGHNNDVARRYSMCELVHGLTIFFVKASDTACDWSLQESYKLLKQYCFDKTCVCIH